MVSVGLFRFLVVVGVFCCCFLLLFFVGFFLSSKESVISSISYIKEYTPWPDHRSKGGSLTGTDTTRQRDVAPW